MLEFRIPHNEIEVSPMPTTQKLYSLFDVRRSIPARVFVSIFLSVLLISTLLIIAYSFSAMNEITQVSV